MNIVEIAKESFRTVWEHKYLWVLGLFAAAAGGGGGGAAPGGTAGTRGAELPGWLLPVLIAAAVLALVILLAHVISEGALIDSVRRHTRGEKHSFSTALGSGLHHFWRVLGVKLALVGIAGASALLIVVPALLMVLRLIPVWAGLALILPLGLAAIPWLMTLYFVYMFAMRFVVVDGQSVRASIRSAYRFLHGRILDSIQLVVAEALGRAAVSLAGAVGVVIVGGALAAVLYFAWGLVPAIVAGAAIALPTALVAGGLTGAFGSSLWTIAFLEQRAD